MHRGVVCVHRTFPRLAAAGHSAQVWPANVWQAVQTDVAAASAAASALAAITAVNQHRWGGASRPDSRNPGASPGARFGAPLSPRPQASLPADLYSTATTSALRVRPRSAALLRAMLAFQDLGVSM